MNKFSLQLVLDLVERQAETLAREVKRSHGEWLLARGHQVQLQVARDRQIHALAGELAPGLNAAVLMLRSQFLQRQQADLQRAAQRVETCHQAWQARLAQWMHAHDRVKALKVLERYHLDAQAVQERRIEQRQHDELAQNTRFWRRDSEEAA